MTGDLKDILTDGKREDEARLMSVRTALMFCRERIQKKEQTSVLPFQILCYYLVKLFTSP